MDVSGRYHYHFPPSCYLSGQGLESVVRIELLAGPRDGSPKPCLLLGTRNIRGSGTSCLEFLRGRTSFQDNFKSATLGVNSTLVQYSAEGQLSPGRADWWTQPVPCHRLVGLSGLLMYLQQERTSGRLGFPSRSSTSESTVGGIGRVTQCQGKGWDCIWHILTKLSGPTCFLAAAVEAFARRWLRFGLAWLDWLKHLKGIAE